MKANPLHDKLKSISEVARIARRARAQGKTVVTANGCFDILHVGHVKTLEWAKRQGDLLIVGINSDPSVRALKGPKRPIVRDKERAVALAGLAAVDYVFIFNNKSPIPWIKAVKPSIHVKGRGSERHPAFKPEENAVKRGGGKIVLAPLVKGYSTTKIIEIVRKRYGGK